MTYHWKAKKPQASHTEDWLMTYADIKDGRQHFHVIWNRVSMKTGTPHYPFKHKMQSKIVARVMEIELGLKKPMPRSSRKTGTLRSKAQSAYRGTKHHRSTPRSRQTIAPIHFVSHPFKKSAPISLRVPVPISMPIFQAAIPASEPIRPMLMVRSSGMCEAQRIDLAAASEGKITWAQYFEKWGGSCNQGGCSP